jgi:hypothetical protein
VVSKGDVLLLRGDEAARPLEIQYELGSADEGQPVRALQCRGGSDERNQLALPLHLDKIDALEVTEASRLDRSPVEGTAGHDLHAHDELPYPFAQVLLRGAAFFENEGRQDHETGMPTSATGGPIAVSSNIPMGGCPLASRSPTPRDSWRCRSASPRLRGSRRKRAASERAWGI